MAAFTIASEGGDGASEDDGVGDEVVAFGPVIDARREVRYDS